MSEVILAQSTPTLNVETTLYTIPVGKSGIYDLNICNRNSVAAAVSFAITKSATKSYLCHALPLPASGDPDNFITLSNRITLPAGTVFSILSTVADVDFVLSGVEEEL
jgi:hypothetical protein